MMKHLFCILALFLISVSMQAQDRFSCSVEVSAGVGVGRGPLVTVTPQLVAQYELDCGFKLGAGTGARFAMPCLQYITKNGTHERTFCDEFDIPVFLRLGYGKEMLFANVDAGYAIGVLSSYGKGWVPGGKKKPCYNGFFFEPQFGCRLGKHSALALGVLMQQSIVSDYVHTETGTIGDPSYSTSLTVTNQKLLTPAITLRYAFIF